MAATASISLAGTVNGHPGGNNVIGPLTITSSNANYDVRYYNLTSGYNGIAIPTVPAPTGVIIKLNASNTATVTLKGVSNDTGIKIGKTGFILLTWESTNVPANLYLDSSATQTGLDTCVIWF